MYSENKEALILVLGNCFFPRTEEIPHIFTV